MKLFKYIFLAIFVAFSACQDSQYTDPLDFEEVTGSGDPEEGSYSGGAPIILLDDGTTTGALNFNQYTYPSSTFAAESGNTLALASSGLSARRLDLFDTAGDGTYQFTLPVLTNSRRSSVFEADVTFPSGAADSGYQIARAYSADLDGDQEEDTVAYAVIVIGGVQQSENAGDGYDYQASNADPSSSHAIAGLFLGNNAEPDDSAEAELKATYDDYQDIFGDDELGAIQTLASLLNGKPGIAIARSVEFSGQNESVVGGRTDSGLSVQIIPIAQLGQADDLVDDAELSVTPNIIDTGGGPTSNSWAEGTLAFTACEANSGTTSGGACTSGSSAGYANEWRANNIANNLTLASSFTAGSIDDGVTGTDLVGFQLYDANNDLDHTIKVEFNVVNASTMQLVVTIVDQNNNEVVITSTDSLSATVSGAQGDLNAGLAGTQSLETDSERIAIANCNGETDIGQAYSEVTLSPYYFSSSNVFGEFDECQNSAIPAVTLGNGSTIFDSMFSGGVNGYAVSLGYVPAGALAFDETIDALQALDELVTAQGGNQTPTVSNIRISIPDAPTGE